MRPRAEAGFTLIELVLALTILAMMVTILFGGFRVGLRAWQGGEARAEALQHTRSMTRFVEGALGGIYPYRARLEKDGPVQIAFKGERDRVSFVTVSPPVPFQVPIAFTAVTVSMAEGETPGLAIQEKALPNFDPFEPVPPSLVDPTVTSVRFRYLRDVDGGNWEESWDAAEELTLPRVVEVTLSSSVSGKSIEHPPIRIPVRVTTP